MYWSYKLKSHEKKQQQKKKLWVQRGEPSLDPRMKEITEVLIQTLVISAKSPVSESVFKYLY